MPDDRAMDTIAKNGADCPEPRPHLCACAAGTRHSWFQEFLTDHDRLLAVQRLLEWAEHPGPHTKKHAHAVYVCGECLRAILQGKDVL